MRGHGGPAQGKCQSGLPWCATHVGALVEGVLFCKSLGFACLVMEQVPKCWTTAKNCF